MGQQRVVVDARSRRVTGLLKRRLRPAGQNHTRTRGPHGDRLLLSGSVDQLRELAALAE